MAEIQGMWPDVKWLLIAGSLLMLIGLIPFCAGIVIAGRRAAQAQDNAERVLNERVN